MQSTSVIARHSGPLAAVPVTAARRRSIASGGAGAERATPARRRQYPLGEAASGDQADQRDVSPIQKLQTIIKRTPTMTRMPPSAIAPVFPPVPSRATRSLLSATPTDGQACPPCFRHMVPDEQGVFLRELRSGGRGGGQPRHGPRSGSAPAAVVAVRSA